MKETQENKWTLQYKNTKDKPVYPTEFVIRMIAGANYPDFKHDKNNYIGKKIVDISCGDGRNLQLLLNLGFDVYATETTPEIIETLKPKFPDVKFTLAFNHNHPFDDNFFDYALACGAIYYLEPGTSFQDNMKELNRIMKPNGLFYANVPTSRHCILDNAERLENGEFLIQNDPHGYRNGYRWQTADQKDVLRNIFSPYFNLDAIGTLEEDYFGYLLSNHIVVANAQK